MGNYCNGTITCKGPHDLLDLLNVLTNRLDDCAGVSGFDADEDYLMHIFKEEYSTQGIFYEGGDFEGDDLQMYIRAARTTGEEYFSAMASGLGITIKWAYTSDMDYSHHTKTFKPKKNAPKWELRTEEELDAEYATDMFGVGPLEPDVGSQGSSVFRIGGFSPGGFESLARKLAQEPQGSYVYGSGDHIPGSHTDTRLGAMISSMDLEQANRYASREYVAQESDTSSEDGSVDKGPDSLRDSIYFHCLAASTLAREFQGESDLYPRSRLCADVAIAAAEMQEYIRVAASPTVQQAHAEDFRTLGRYVGLLESAFEVSVFDLKCTSVLHKEVSYAIFMSTFRLVQYMASYANPDFGLQLAALRIPPPLW